MKSKNYDVVIIGGGPAGMAAAIESYNNGAKTLLIEREGVLGGILNQCIHNGFGIHYFKEELTGPEYALKFVEMLKNTKVDVMLDTFVVSINQLNIVVLNNLGKTYITAKAIILTTGCRERTPAEISLTGTRPVGIYTAGQVQKMVNIEGCLPGKKSIILGSGDIGLIMARRLTYQGAKVCEVLEIMKESAGLQRNISQCLKDYNIPLKLQHTIDYVVGEDKLKGVYVTKVDENYNPIANSKYFIKCDNLILSVGLVPEIELVKEVKTLSQTGGPAVNEYRETSIKGVFGCGNVLHVHDLVDNVTEESVLTGKFAALFAKGKLDYSNPIKVNTGNLIKYCLPTTAFNNKKGELTIYFRATQKIIKSFIVVECENQEIYSKFVLAVNAGEMQKIVIDKNKINGDITLLIKEKK